MLDITSILQPVGGTSDAPISFFEAYGLLDIPDDLLQTLSCNIPFSVEDYIPSWIVDAHDTGDTNLVKFLQYYYDWMYCFDISGLHTENINELQDIENLNDLTRQSFINTFVPQIDFSVLNLSNSDLINFLKNFKRDILGRKGTAQGIALFFSKLFPEVDEVLIQESNLNYSITLTISGTPKPESVYINAYEALVKPVGISYNFNLNFSAGSQYTELAEDSELEQRLAKESGFTLTAYEVPLLGNYYVYPMGSSTTIDSESGCSGSTHPSAIAGNTANMPTFVHPNESIEGAGGSRIGNINIYEFLYMDYETSPNIGITSCS